MEEHTTTTEQKKPSKLKSTYVKPAAITVGAILVVALSFTAGTQFEQHHGKHAGIRGGRLAHTMPGMRRAGVHDTVTAISSTSITVKNERTNATSTYAITSSTQILNNGANATISDIKTGDTVRVRASNTDTNTAAEIEINPSFRGTDSDMPDDMSGSVMVN